MHSWIAPYKLRIETRNIFFKRNGCSEKRWWKWEGECAAIKKPSTGRVFEFFTVFICVGKKTNYSSVWRLRCAISTELLTLVCVCNIFTSTADFVLPRCFWWSRGCVFAQMWQRRMTTLDCCDDLILLWDTPASSHPYIYTSFLTDGVLCVASLVFKE